MEGGRGANGLPVEQNRHPAGGSLPGGGCERDTLTHRVIAGVLLALAALIYFSRPAPEDLTTWTPVAHPLPSTPGRVDIPPFTAAEDRTFHLFLYGGSNDDKCPQSAIDWTILRNGAAVASGASKADKLGFYGGGTACWIAELKAQKGQQYAVSLNVHSIALTNARLLVQTYPNACLDAYHGKLFHRDLAAAAGALLALSGVTILLTVPILKRVLA